MHQGPMIWQQTSCTVKALTELKLRTILPECNDHAAKDKSHLVGFLR